MSEASFSLNLKEETLQKIFLGSTTLATHFHIIFKCNMRSSTLSTIITFLSSVVISQSLYYDHFGRPEFCNYPPATPGWILLGGKCWNIVPLFYFNLKTQKCHFYFGCSDKSRNQFKTYRQCKNVCEAPISSHLGPHIRWHYPIFPFCQQGLINN